MTDYQAAQIEAAQEFHANEMSHDSDSDRRWFKFLRDAEKALGLKDMDGDEREDGYSLDGAHDAFCAETPVMMYVQAVKNKMATMPDSLLASYGPNDEIPGAR